MTVYETSHETSYETGSPAPPDELRAEIAQARAELGETLQALAARADVRTRARESASHAAERVRQAWRSPAPWVAVSGSLAAAALVVALVRGRHK